MEKGSRSPNLYHLVTYFFKMSYRMKSYLITAICFVCIMPSAKAQFSVGIQGGYTRAWEKYSEDVGVPDDAKIHIHTYHVTASFYYQISQKLYLGIEPGFAQRGAACVPGFVDFVGETKLYFSYAEIPVMLKLQLPFTEKMGIEAKVGYGGAYMLAAKQVTDYGATSETEIIDLNNNGNYNRIEHGYFNGLGLYYSFSKTKLVFSAEFYNSFTDAVAFISSKNRSIDLGLGYVFEF